MARKLDYFGPDAAAFLAKEPNLDVPVRTLKEIEPGIFSHDGVQVCFVQLGEARVEAVAGRDNWVAVGGEGLCVRLVVEETKAGEGQVNGNFGGEGQEGQKEEDVRPQVRELYIRTAATTPLL